ncbi:hypothetical protein [Larkinella terrae]|uniref:Uncharacterized protein n=1 Tax=Larkinella terrae TaxID=2025311 RepID=A0A7K0EU52_9BACT|nr:hypothetical protein [Larkinella terrae]MRS65340.1 hypothetical protein [Larkinella terrae]
MLAFSSFGQSQYANVWNIRALADTVRKQIVFQYNLVNIEPSDSLYLELKLSNGQTVRPRSVLGDAGTHLTPGPDKTIFWDAIADRQKFNDDVEVVLKIKSLYKARQGLVLGKKQVINLGRWTIGTGLAAFAIVKSVSLMKDIKKYNDASLPGNEKEKLTFDTERDNLRLRQSRIYPLLGVSVAVLLGNLAYSWVQREKAKHNRFTFIGTATSTGLAYSF